MKKLLLSLLGLALALPLSAQAAWPDKTITVIVPFGAGGTADASGRLVARELEKRLGTKIIVKNVAGATGTLGAAEVARAKADGYTLGWFPPGPSVGMPNMRALPYKRDSFQPVGMVFEEVSYFTTAKTAPWNDLDALIKDVKANPQKYVYGAPGLGGAVHLSIYSMLKTLGLVSDCKFVPERSNADILKAIAGGTTHFHAAQGTELQRFDLKAFFVADDQRNPSFPDVPTAKELGYDVPRITNWYGLFAPAGISDDVLTKLSKAMTEMASDPEFQAAAQQMSCTVHYLPTKEFTEFYKNQYATYGDLIKEVTAKAE